MRLLQLISFLPWQDWLAVLWFLFCWIGYTFLSRHLPAKRHIPSLLSVTNHYRHLWMRQAQLRQQRPLDAIIVQNLSTAPSFFASTSLIIIGAVLAMLSSNSEVAHLFSELPFSEATPLMVFNFKVAVLLVIFVFAFFRFSWSIRQYTFANLLIGSIPDTPDTVVEGYNSDVYAKKTGRLLGLAAEAFNAGIRSYYFSFAAICWFFSPLAFALASTLVAVVLYRREFHSNVLKVLKK